MSSSVRGFCVFRAGWTGYCVVSLPAGPFVSVAPATHTSALSYSAAMMTAARAEFSDASFAVTISAAGKIVLSADQTFALSFLDTGNAQGRLGFSADTYAAATSHTAEGAHSGSVYPYGSESLRYTLDQPIPDRAAFLLEGRAIMARTPATDWRQPDARITGLRGVCLDVIEVFTRADTPGKISILIEPSTVVDLHLGKIRSKTIDRMTGWGSVDLEVAL